jgi:hypothetical protein
MTVRDRTHHLSTRSVAFIGVGATALVGARNGVHPEGRRP